MSGQKFLSLIFTLRKENFFGIMEGVQSLSASLPESCIAELFFLFDGMRPECEAIGNVLLPSSNILVHFIPCGHLRNPEAGHEMAGIIPALFQEWGTPLFPLETKECAVIAEESEKAFLEKLLKENFAFLADEKKIEEVSRNAELFLKEKIEKIIPKIIFGDRGRFLGVNQPLERKAAHSEEKMPEIQQEAAKSESFEIILGFNDAYSLPGYVTMQSILDHLPPHKKASFHILYNDLSADIIEIGKKLFSTEKSAISFHCCAEMMKGQHFCFHVAHWKPENYLPVLIPAVFADFEKTLFIDADILVRDDISGLFEGCGPEDKIAAVPSVTARMREVVNPHDYFESLKYYGGVVGMKRPENYFNSGIVVFNHKNILKEDAEKAIAYIAKQWQSCDESILNKVFEDHYKMLPAKWNFDFDFIWQDHQRFPEKYREEWHEAQQNPAIVHYLGQRKPWEVENLPFSAAYNEVWNRVVEKIGKKGVSLFFSQAAA